LQTLPPLDEIVGVGITVYDRVDGPFALELDYIGIVAEFNYGVKKPHVYENYMLPRAGFDKE